MSSKLNKLELNINSFSKSNQPKKPNFDDPQKISPKEKEESPDIELDNILFERTKEEDEEIKNLEKIYQSKLKEIEKLTNEIKLKDDEILLMNDAKNKLFNIESPNPGEEKKNINVEKKDLTEEELNSELIKIGKEYNEEVHKCTQIHEEKMKNLKEEISRLKEQVKVYYNKNEFISKEESDKYLDELKKKHELELAPLKKELNDLEKYIADNFPNIKNNA